MDFRTWLRDYMDRNGMTMMGLSQKLGYSSKNAVNTILVGYGAKSKRPPNSIKLDEVEMWVNALHFNKTEAERFREEVNLDHCEEWFKERYRKMRSAMLASRSDR